MSTWKNIPKDDIEVVGDEINILIGSDDSGNNYVVLKLQDIKDLL
jgi:hypothetical protein